MFVIRATPEVSSPSANEGFARIDGGNRRSVMSVEEKRGLHLLVEGLLKFLHGGPLRLAVAPVVPRHRLVGEGFQECARAKIPVIRETLERAEEVEDRRSWKYRYPNVEPLEGATVVPPCVSTEG